jgi:antitoxin CptB
MDDHEIRLKRLKYRAWHRGFREADLILGPFADKHGRGLTEIQLASFERLLEQPDHDLYVWIVERTPTPPEFDTDVMTMIKQFRDDAFAARGDAHGG